MNSMFCPYPDVWPDSVADHWQLFSNNSIYPRVLFPLSVMDVDIEKIRFKQIALTAHRYPAIYLSVSNADCLFLIH